MKKIFFVLVLFIALNFFSAITYAETTLDYYVNSSQLINVDELYEINEVSLNDDYTFNFTPSATGYYIIETYGDVDTSIYFSNTYYNQDNGYNENETVGFEGFTQTTYTFTVSVESVIMDDTITIQVRRQSISVLSVNNSQDPGEISSPYSQFGINTTANASFIDNLLDTGGALANTYEKQTEIGINENLISDITLDNGLSRFNSDFLIYSSHGNYGQFSVVSGSTFTYLDSSNLPDMSNTRLAIWASCRSASSSSTEDSVAKESVDKGADVAIGWTDTVGIYSSHLVIKHLMTLILNNVNDSISDLLNEAISLTTNQLSNEDLLPVGFGDFYTSIEIFGDEDAIITFSSSTVNSKNSQSNFIPEYEVVSLSSPIISTINVAERSVTFKYTNNTNRVVMLYVEIGDTTPDNFVKVIQPGEYYTYTFNGLSPDHLYSFYARFRDFYRTDQWSSYSGRSIRTLGGGIILW